MERYSGALSSSRRRRGVSPCRCCGEEESPPAAECSSSYRSASTSAASALHDERCLSRRALLRKGLDRVVLTFNQSGYKAAMHSLRGLVNHKDPQQIASFLFFVSGLNKREVGKALGDASPFSQEVLRHFLHLFQFNAVELTEALRVLFSKFHPPGEAQELFRVITEFAAAYVRDNSACGMAADDVAFLSYAILMLHTDRHNVQVKRKMSRISFMKLFEKRSFDPALLNKVYDDVCDTEFRVLSSDADLVYERLAALLAPSSTASAAVPTVRSAFSPPPSRELSLVTLNSEILAKKNIFFKYCRSGAVKLRVVFLDGPTLRWAPQSDSPPTPRRAIRLHDIKDVTLGSHCSASFQKYRVPLTMELRCCSVHTATRTLDLCAPIDAQQPLELWAASLLCVAQRARQCRQGGGRSSNNNNVNNGGQAAAGSASRSARRRMSLPPGPTGAKVRKRNLSEPRSSRDCTVNYYVNEEPIVRSSSSSSSSSRTPDTVVCFSRRKQPFSVENWERAIDRAWRRSILPNLGVHFNTPLAVKGDCKLPPPLFVTHLPLPPPGMAAVCKLLPEPATVPSSSLSAKDLLSQHSSRYSTADELLSSGKLSTQLTSSFAARLECIRSIWSREQEGFLKLMTGEIRVPCSAATTENNTQPTVTTTHDEEDSLLLLFEPGCYWSPELLQMPQKVRWRGGREEPRPQLSDLALAFNFRENYLLNCIKFSPVLRNFSRELIGLWWTGLPQCVRPLLWEKVLLANSATRRQHPLLESLIQAVHGSNDRAKVVRYIFQTRCRVSAADLFKAMTDKPLVLFEGHVGWVSRVVKQGEDLSGRGNGAAGCCPGRWQKAFSRLTNTLRIPEELTPAPGETFDSSYCALCAEFVRHMLCRAAAVDCGACQTDLKFRLQASFKHVQPDLRRRQTSDLKKTPRGSTPTLGRGLSPEAAAESSSRPLNREPSAPPAASFPATADLLHLTSSHRTRTSSCEACCPRCSLLHGQLACCSAKNGLSVRCCTVMVTTAIITELGIERVAVCHNLLQLVAFVCALCSDSQRVYRIVLSIVASPTLPVGDFMVNTQDPIRHRRVIGWLQLFQACFAAKLPLLFKHFKALELGPEYYLPRLFTTLFLCHLPLPCAAAVWDRLLAAQAPYASVEMALGVLKYLELLLLTSSFAGCLSILGFGFFLHGRPALGEAAALLMHFDDARFWRSVGYCELSPSETSWWMESLMAKLESQSIGEAFERGW